MNVSAGEEIGKTLIIDFKTVRFNRSQKFYAGKDG